MKLFSFFFFILIFISSDAQNVGIGTTTPEAPLHVKSAFVSNVLKLEGVNPYIGFYDNTKGYIGYLWYNSIRLELGTPSGSTEPVVIAPGRTSFTYFTTSGRLGLGISNPTETIDLNGNIQLNSSNKGIILDNADAPFITRGWDAFTSGPYSGLGRWGLFMQPSRLTIGIPNVVGKGFNISTFNPNSTIARNIISVTQDANVIVDGKITRPSTGGANLIPICMGTVDHLGGIVNGTGNFSVFKEGASGLTEITIDGEIYNESNFITNVTITKIGLSTQRGYAQAAPTPTGKLSVFQYDRDGNVANMPFHFVVYKLN